METIRGFLKAYEHLNSSSSEYGYANWGELKANGNLNEQIEKCLSSSNRQAKVKTISVLANPEKELRDDFVPWMFAFLGIYRSEDGSIDYSSSTFSSASKEKLLQDQAQTLVTMIMDKAKPEEVSRIEWSLTYRWSLAYRRSQPAEDKSTRSTITPYMGNDWCAFVFKNSDKVYFLGLTSILN